MFATCSWSGILMKIWSWSVFNLEYPSRLLMVQDHKIRMFQDHVVLNHKLRPKCQKSNPIDYSKYWLLIALIVYQSLPKGICFRFINQQVLVCIYIWYIFADIINDFNLNLIFVSSSLHKEGRKHWKIHVPHPNLTFLMPLPGNPSFASCPLHEIKGKFTPQQRTVFSPGITINIQSMFRT